MFFLLSTTCTISWQYIYINICTSSKSNGRWKTKQLFFIVIHLAFEEGCFCLFCLLEHRRKPWHHSFLIKHVPLTELFFYVFPFSGLGQPQLSSAALVGRSQPTALEDLIQEYIHICTFYVNHNNWRQLWKLHFAQLIFKQWTAPTFER